MPESGGDAVREGSRNLTVDALVSGQAQMAYTQMLVNAKSKQYTREMAREVAEY